MRFVLGFFMLLGGIFGFQLLPSLECSQNAGSCTIGAFAALFAIILGIALMGSAWQKDRDAKKAKLSSTTSGPQKISLEQELAKLDDMKRRGVIDESEYKQLRANVINKG